MSPKVSIIVPVYNTIEYLPQCLDSLVNQTLREVEIILVDDGSSDGSGETCDEYARKYPCLFQVFHKDNGGSASARNIGLKYAKGDYIIVCDSDDWVDKDMYEILWRSAIENNADIVSCDYYFEYPDGSSLHKKGHITATDQHSVIIEILSGSNNSSCSKLIRKSLFDEHKINYQEDINLGEDALILYKLLPFCKCFVPVKRPLYHYRRNILSGSYTNSMTMNKAKQLMAVYNWLKTNYPLIYKEWIHKQAVNAAFAMLRSQDLVKSVLQNFLKKELPLRSYHFRHASIKEHLIYLTKFLGINMGIHIVNKAYKYVYK